MKQRRERSMSDPDIQAIISDPVMAQVRPPAAPPSAPATYGGSMSDPDIQAITFDLVMAQARPRAPPPPHS
jgi:hypothetical protein